jgi:serine/threonine protein kinase
MRQLFGNNIAVIHEFSMKQPNQSNQIEQKDGQPDSPAATRLCHVCGLHWHIDLKSCPRDGTNLLSPIETDPAFSKYEFVGVLGAGGMGIVYKARQMIIDKLVAIKMLHPHLMSAEAVQRFQRESKTSSMLEHPYIIKMYDVGVCGAGPYMVLEFVQGHTLAQVLEQEGPLPMQRFLNIFIQFCDALQYAHSCGVFHRDLKPSNVMLTRNRNNEEEIRIMDFGIAKLIDESANESFAAKLTRTGEAIGSPSYMSPEQAQNGKIDARSDLYSTGCVIFEALTGAPPFARANALETLMAHLSEQPLSMSQAMLGAKTFDPNVEQIVARLLQKDPDLRFQSMLELKDQLVAIRDGHGMGKFVYQGQREKSVKRRTPIILALSTVAICLSIVSILCLPKANNKQHASETSATTDTEFKKFHPVKDISSVASDNKNTDVTLPEGLTEDKDLEGLQHNTSLVRLGLRKTAVEGEGLKNLVGIPTLKILVLSGSSVHDLSALKDMPALEQLELDSTSIDDAQLAPIADLQLKRIDLSGTNVSTLAALKNMRSLEQVSLRNASHIGGEALRVLGRLTNLQKLDLDGTPIVGADLDCLANLQKLEELDLYECANLTDENVFGLGAKLPSDCVVHYVPKRQRSHQSVNLPANDLLSKVAKNADKATRYYENNNFEESRKLVRNNLQMLESAAEKHWSLIKQTYQSLAQCETAMKHPQASIDAYNKAIHILETHPEIGSNDLPADYVKMGNCACLLGHSKEALGWFAHASDLFEKLHPQYPIDANDLTRARIDRQWKVDQGANLLGTYCAINNKGDAAQKAHSISLLENGLTLLCNDSAAASTEPIAEFRRELGDLYVADCAQNPDGKFKMHRLQQAIEQYKQAKEILCKLPATKGIALSIRNLDTEIGRARVASQHHS